MISTDLCFVPKFVLTHVV